MDSVPSSEEAIEDDDRETDLPYVPMVLSGDLVLWLLSRPFFFANFLPVVYKANEWIPFHYKP